MGKLEQTQNLDEALERLLEGDAPQQKLEALLDSQNPEEQATGIAFVQQMLECEAHWQTQALGFHLVREKKRWNKLKRKFGDRVYVSFGELCYDYDVSPSTGYQRGDFAAHPRFEALRKADVTMYVTGALYSENVSDELFGLLVDIVAVGCSDKRIADLLKLADPMEAAWRLASKLKEQKRIALKRLEQQLTKRSHSK
jgi:hypothetical protein